MVWHDKTICEKEISGKQNQIDFVVVFTVVETVGWMLGHYQLDKCNNYRFGIHEFIASFGLKHGTCQRARQPSTSSFFYSSSDPNLFLPKWQKKKFLYFTFFCSKNQNKVDKIKSYRNDTETHSHYRCLNTKMWKLLFIWLLLLIPPTPNMVKQRYNNYLWKNNSNGFDCRVIWCAPNWIELNWINAKATEMM